MKKRIVIYHGRCLDGFTAAWAAWLKFGDVDTEYLPANYGDDAPAVDGREVYVVDFSYPRDVTIRMHSQAASLRIFDHHKTAQEAISDLPCAVFDMQRSGAGITWDELHTSPRPWLVSYVEDRDLWRFALPGSREVNAWVGACRREVFGEWTALNGIGVGRAAERGEAVLTYIDRYVYEMADQARNVDFAGYRVPCVNAPYICISELVGHLAETASFAMGWYQDRGGVYRYSLRSRGSDGVDVSEIAKRFGGGGHRNAAGFSSLTRVDA